MKIKSGEDGRSDFSALAMAEVLSFAFLLPIVLVGSCAAWLSYGAVFGAHRALWLEWVASSPLWWLKKPLLSWSLLGLLQLGIRTALWLSYRPYSSLDKGAAPSLSVIIPAYNEGRGVADSIESVAMAKYPEGRLEIVVIDDGSLDDTWTHIEKTAARFPTVVRSMRLEKNRGKREALYAGFRRANGEILVTIDSDSIIDKQALLAIAGAFRDARIGAVAGKVSVRNLNGGTLPKMLQSYFLRSFDFIRAAQSTYRTVQCCPGALSAYRGQALRKVLNRWRHQTFLGGPPPPGEDRALTNFILEAGYDSVYQRLAVVHTIVPQTYGRLCKMYTRWNRGFFCEEFRLACLLWKRPLLSRWMTFWDMVITNVQYPLSYLTLVCCALIIPRHPEVFLWLLMGIGGVSILNMLYCFVLEPSWRCLFSVAYDYYAFFFLWWIFPYSFFTMRSRAWGTR